VPLAIDDFDAISRRTPIVASLKPSGAYMAVHVHQAVGIPLIARMLAEGGLLHKREITVPGRSLGEKARRARETPGQRAAKPVSDPFKPTGGVVILKGNLTPEGSVLKIAGHELPHHRGPARVFDREEDAMKAITNKSIKPGDVLVIRYEDPRGGPGMREMFDVTGALVAEGLA
jgi:dihydroxy-acid dehydratase